MLYELVSCGNHQRNIAEREIQTAKNNFLAILCGAHDDFPMHLWCQIPPQSEWQMNMLRKSNVAPNVSVYAHSHGQHDYMRHPWPPVGFPFQVNEPAEFWKSWYKHTMSG